MKKKNLIHFATITIPAGLYKPDDAIQLKNHPMILTKEGKKIFKKVKKYKND